MQSDQVCPQIWAAHSPEGLVRTDVLQSVILYSTTRGASALTDASGEFGYSRCQSFFRTNRIAVPTGSI